MLMSDLWGISFHAMVVFGLGKNLLFKSVLGRCDETYCAALVTVSKVAKVTLIRSLRCVTSITITTTASLALDCQ